MGHSSTDLASLAAAVDVAILFSINVRRGCTTGAVGGAAWVSAHALAHLSLGHLARCRFTAADEASADELAWVDWFLLDANQR
jgi:hypothetical protein